MEGRAKGGKGDEETQVSVNQVRKERSKDGGKKKDKESKG